MTVHVRSIASVAATAAVFTTASLPDLSAAQTAVPTCFGQPATIIGTAGDDLLVGSAGDVVYAAGGNDTIDLNGGYGCGGAGADDLSGTEAAEHMAGGGGADEIASNFGANGGVDTMLGGGGDDVLWDNKEDKDYGDASDPGDDVMRGGSGDDILFSTAGADRLFGDAGNDYLDDYTRATTYLYGGAGHDKFSTFGDNYGCNRLQPDFIFGGRNWDKALIDQEPGAEDVWSASTERVVIRDHWNDDYCN